MTTVLTLRESRARAEKACVLRAVGRSWREVANELGYQSVGAVQLAVKRHERRNGPEPVESSRQSLVTSARITHAILFDRFAAAIDREDDATAALLNRELVRNRDQLARLQGAYAPDRHDVDVTVRQSATEIIADAKQRLLAIDNTIEGELVE